MERAGTPGSSSHFLNLINEATVSYGCCLRNTTPLFDNSYLPISKCQSSQGVVEIGLLASHLHRSSHHMVHLSQGMDSHSRHYSQIRRCEMRRVLAGLMFCIFAGVTTGYAAAAEVFVFPKSGQTKEQQEQDEFTCHMRSLITTDDGVSTARHRCLYIQTWNAYTP